MFSSLHFYHLLKIKLLYIGKPFCSVSLGLILCDNKVGFSIVLIYHKKQKMSTRTNCKILVKNKIYTERGEINGYKKS